MTLQISFSLLCFRTLVAMSETAAALKNALDKQKRPRGPASRTQRYILKISLLIKVKRQRSPEGKASKVLASATPRGQGDSPKPKSFQVETNSHRDSLCLCAESRIYFIKPGAAENRSNCPDSAVTERPWISDKECQEVLLKPKWVSDTEPGRCDQERQEIFSQQTTTTWISNHQERSQDHPQRWQSSR